jgi:membrane-associated protein
VPVVKLVHARVTAAARDQSPIHREGRDEGEGEPERETPPEEPVEQARRHRVGNREHDPVVDDLHRRDRDRVGRESEPKRAPERDAGSDDRPQAQGIAKDEREHDGERDRRQVRPAKRGRKHQAEHLADRTAGEAVDRRLKGAAAESVDTAAAHVAPTFFRVPVRQCLVDGVTAVFPVDGGSIRGESGEASIATRRSCGDAVRVFESLVDLITASGWVYALIVLIAALDAVFPLVPSEATVIAAAALAGTGELVLALVVVAGASGAVIGDNVAYLLGRAGQGPLLRRLSRSPKWRARVRGAEVKLRQRAGTVIVVSRFIPGGRTATMLSAGLAGLHWRRFAAYDLAAGLLWAGYASVVGWAGGRAFADKPLQALLVAFALAAALALLIEGGRRAFRAATRP